MTNFYQLNEHEQTTAMAALAEHALPLWGLSGSTLSLIKYRENAVFEVNTPSNERFALRIHRHGYHSDEELLSELQWIAALDDYGIEVPSVIKNKQGNYFSLVKIDAVPEERQIDVFEWVDGNQLGSVETRLNDDAGQASNASQAADESFPHSYKTIGQIAASLHNQAVSWELPQGFKRHAWDTDGLVGDAPFWGEFWELQTLTASEKELLLCAKGRAKHDLEQYASSRQNSGLYSMIHADFVTENLMVDGSHVRLIDFDDAGFGWHLFELATALYFEMEEPHFLKSYDALIAGYREKRDLSDGELAYMPLFFLLRSFTYLGWVHTRFETKTARELAPMLTRKACALSEEYLSHD